MHHQASMPFVILFSLPRTFCPLSHFIWVTPVYRSKSSLEFKSSSYYFLCLPLSPHEQKPFLICIPVALYELQTPPMLRLRLTQDLTQNFTYSRCSMWSLTLQIFIECLPYCGHYFKYWQYHGGKSRHNSHLHRVCSLGRIKIDNHPKEITSVSLASLHFLCLV